MSVRWVGFAKIVTQQLSGPGALTPEALMRITWMKSSFAVGALIGVLLTLVEQKKSWQDDRAGRTGMPLQRHADIFVTVLGRKSRRG